MYRECLCPTLRVEMFTRGYDNRELGKAAGIKYTTLCRKLRESAPFTVDEAVQIRKALDSRKTVEELFHRKES